MLLDHTEARSELAMALVETGNDAWNSLIMGNLYTLTEKDLGSAARYYESALDPAPNDPDVIMSHGGVERMHENYGDCNLQPAPLRADGTDRSSNGGEGIFSKKRWPKEGLLSQKM